MPTPRAAAATRSWTKWRPLTFCRARWIGCGTSDEQRFRARAIFMAVAPAGADRPAHRAHFPVDRVGGFFRRLRHEHLLSGRAADPGYVPYPRKPDRAD